LRQEVGDGGGQCRAVPSGPEDVPPTPGWTADLEKVLEPSKLFLIVLPIAVATSFYWDHNIHVKMRYYASIAEKRGILVGVRPLDARTAAVRRLRWRVDERKGRVIRVRMENSAGQLRASSGGVSEWIVEYSADGSVEQVGTRAHNGKILRESHFSAWLDNGRTAIVDLRLFGAGLALENPGRTSGSPCTRSVATQRRYEYDSAGWPVVVIYADVFGSPGETSHGVFGWQQRFNESGQVIEARPLDQSGRPMIGRDGIAATRSRYDWAGQLAEKTTLGVADEPIIDGRTRYAARKFAYDRFGREVESSTFGADGQLVLA